MKLLIRILTAGLILGLVWAGLRFIRGNEAAVEIDYLFSQSATLPLWQGLTIAFATGWFLGCLVFGYGWMKARLEAHRYRKAHRKLEAEVEGLRDAAALRAQRAESAAPATTAAVAAGQATGSG